jgi:hypothetical protein
MGDSLVWQAGQVLEMAFERLEKADLIRVVTAEDAVDLYQAPSKGSYQAIYSITTPGFYRVEVWRNFLPGIPPLPALLSNPIYFDGP